ncbi:MAG: SIS domain-containing protein [Chloroflexota bacterium]|nr:SIS domain-containing protein [Chloroflexota bacterium]MDE2896941.1 SIS domain-containing protein [Chloroflexota bacterium]
MTDRVSAHLRNLGGQIAALTSADIEPLTSAVEAAWAADRTVFVAGNGGSAATASHFATDLSKTAAPKAPGARGIRAVALTDNMGLLTAWANDHSFEHVFAEQLRNLARCDDLFIAISTSGESPNLLAAVSAAGECGVQSLALAPPASTLGRRAGILVPIEGESVQISEDLHHIVCHAVTARMADVLANAASR